MTREEGFIVSNATPADVIRVDFQEGVRASESRSFRYNIDIGRVALVDWHRLLRTSGADPTLRERYERSLDHIQSMMEPEEFEEAQEQARAIIINETKEK